jgi:hypothetical protein
MVITYIPSVDIGYSYLRTRYFVAYRGFEFSVSGEERVEMKLEESYGINAYYGVNTTSTTYKESDIFF